MYAVLGSIAAHSLVALWCAMQDPPLRSETRLPHTLEFALIGPSAPAVAVSQSARRESSEMAAAAPPRTRKAPEAPASSAARTPTPATEIGTPAAAPPSAVEAVDSSGPPRSLDLSPLAAALTLRDSLASRGRCEAMLADAATCEGGATDAGAAARAHSMGSLRAELAGLRKELQLRPELDGSYSFDGPSFRASVAPDGRVTFHDKIQDLNTFVEHHLVRDQINTSEKRRFMQSTAELRERLAVAAEEQNQRRGKLALQQALRRILDKSDISLVEKRRTIFGLWDDCADDGSGVAAQALIESFVREQLPEGSALGYSASELAQLNRGRLSRRPFDPYAPKPDAGVRPG